LSCQPEHAASDVARALAGAGNVLLLLHEFPDGDSLGSNLAMAMTLERLGKSVTVASPTPPPERLSFVPGFERVVAVEDLRGSLGDFDCLCLIDCSDPRRGGLADEDIARASLVVNVDHHPSNTLFGTVNYVEPSASAAAEQIRLVIAELGVPLDHDMALCLYVAVSTDTGGFRFDNTTAGTHHLAAELLDLGVRPGPVGEIIHDTRTLSSLRLLQRMLGTLGFAAGGRIAWVTVTRRMLEECGATDDEVEGLVSYPRKIEFVAELPKGPTGKILKREIRRLFAAG